MSSPVFATTVRCSDPTTSSMPRASFAPPVPPARTTTDPVLDKARKSKGARLGGLFGAACSVTSMSTVDDPSAALNAATERALAGGPERHHAKSAEQGKLPVRERIALLFDEGS